MLNILHLTGFCICIFLEIYEENATDIFFVILCNLKRVEQSRFCNYPRYLFRKMNLNCKTLYLRKVPLNLMKFGMKLQSVALNNDPYHPQFEAWNFEKIISKAYSSSWQFYSKLNRIIPYVCRGFWSFNIFI